MKIKFIEIQNFRKLKSIHIDFDDETTIFVGANNSGKTSAIVAMYYFLSSPKSLSLRDITIDNISKIDELGELWESSQQVDHQHCKQLLENILPKIDVWLDVPIEQIHQAVHILPTLDWKGGLIGVRLQYLAEKIDILKAAYLEERSRVQEAISKHQSIKKTQNDNSSLPLKLWPKTLSDFLEKRNSHIKLIAYPLDPQKIIQPRHNVVRLQTLPENIPSFRDNPLLELIKVSQIGAQRGLLDTGIHKDKDSNIIGSGRKKKLSEQLRAYYDRHLDPRALPTDADLEALESIQVAENSFDNSLKRGFKKPFQELEDLGYPGIANPKIEISTEIKVKDSLNHGTAIQYNLGDEDKNSLLLPEDYVGLGFQNLISMTFDLMSYRDEWMQVGGEAATKRKIEPIHLVLVEEPEAHLHAQVQQVFVRNAYSLLHNCDELRDNNSFHSQLVISTHSSHVAYEADFSCLRYFKRLAHNSRRKIPRSLVINLSYLFDEPNDTQKFVAKYLKATHCGLFFSDAAIFVEGQAEKLLLPEFIKRNYPKLHKRYYSLIEVGGSHAHKFRKLIEILGIATLIITDLDSVNSDSKKAVAPAVGKDQVTANSVLKKWYPQETQIDKLLSLKAKDHINQGCKGAVYVAFQKKLKKTGTTESFIPRTFEDALIFENSEALKGIEGKGTSAKVKDLVDSGVEGDELASAIFSLVQNAKKGDFALDCLMLERNKDTNGLRPPQYIASGLSWLEFRLDGHNQNSSMEV